MTRVTPMKLVTATIIITAAIVSLLFVFVVGGGSDGTLGRSSVPLPGISLGLTAEARGALLAGDAFPAADAGFAAILSIDASKMDLELVRQKIVEDAPDTPANRS